MAPLHEIQLPTDSQGAPTFRCSGCHSWKLATGFPVSASGTSKGEKRAATCISCTVSRQERNEKKRREQDECLSVISVGRFLSVLEDFRAGCAKECSLEARVATGGLQGTFSDAKGVARALVDALSGTLGWCFQYKDTRSRKSTDGSKRVLYTYTCAQASNRKNKSKKSEDPSKHRDKLPMPTFDCLGRITVALSESTMVKHADITVSHSQDHVPYCFISLPDDVQEIIKTSRNENGEGGWAEVMSGVAMEGLKRSRGEEEAGVEEAGPSRQRRRLGEEEVDEEEERAELASLKGSLIGLADRLQESANILRSQIPHENVTWMRRLGRVS